MFGSLKSFPFVHYIIMAAIGAVVFMYSDLTLTKKALEDERVLREQWQHVAEVKEKILQRDTVIVRVSNEADRAIMEAPSANTPVPTDVADAWAAGIDSVRDAGTRSTDKYDVHRPSGRATKRGNPDTRGTGKVL